MHRCLTSVETLRMALLHIMLVAMMCAVGCSRAVEPRPAPATFFASFSTPYDCDITTCWRALQALLVQRRDTVTPLIETKTDAGLQAANSRATTADGSVFSISMHTDTDSTVYVKLETSRPALIDTMQEILGDLDDSLRAGG